MLALQVARVVSVQEIDSVKLYKCVVELSGGVMKQVMAGLKQHIAKDELLHSLVVVITNLKAAKLAGELSEAMILAAQAPVPDEPKAEMVKVLQPAGQSQYLSSMCLQGCRFSVYSNTAVAPKCCQTCLPMIWTSVNLQLRPWSGRTACLKPFHLAFATC